MEFSPDPRRGNIMGRGPRVEQVCSVRLNSCSNDAWLSLSHRSEYQMKLLAESVGFTLNQSCDCGADFQYMEHVIYYYPLDTLGRSIHLHRFSGSSWIEWVRA